MNCERCIHKELCETASHCFCMDNDELFKDKSRFIEIQCEIGDPVIVLDYDQRDGYYMTYKAFDYRYIIDFGKTVFKTYAEAEKALGKIN